MKWLNHQQLEIRRVIWIKLELFSLLEPNLLTNLLNLTEEIQVCIVNREIDKNGSSTTLNPKSKHSRIR